MASNNRYCVIMCGGIGSRFWPYSRTNLPKQFIDFLGTGRSLLQMAYDRILPIVPKENIIIVTNAMYAPLVKEQLPGLSDGQILLEPARRNTAPCVAWAAYHIAAINPEATMIVTPSDHLITRLHEFEEAIINGCEFVESHDALLTMGIRPTRPETGYGYIQIGGEVTRNIRKVKTFTEKPDYDLASVFVSSGEFFWNSGMFIWRVSAIKKAIAELVPDLSLNFENGASYFGTPQETRYINQAFPGCMNISIDYAVMEKAQNVYVETVDLGWSDLGTWNSLYENSPKNKDGNVAQNCNVMSYNSSGNIFAVRGDKLVVVDGLHDYIVADAGDVLLVCPKGEEQRIKLMVNDARLSFGDKYL